MATSSGRMSPRGKNKSKGRKKKISGIVRDAAQETIEKVREDANQYYEQGRDEIHGLVSSFEQYVREQPVKSVLMGAGIGLLFGHFWMRRRRPF